jgi:hypothetical protein
VQRQPDPATFCTALTATATKCVAADSGSSARVWLMKTCSFSRASRSRTKPVRFCTRSSSQPPSSASVPMDGAETKRCTSPRMVSRTVPCVDPTTSVNSGCTRTRWRHGPALHASTRLCRYPAQVSVSPDGPASSPAVPRKGVEDGGRTARIRCRPTTGTTATYGAVAGSPGEGSGPPGTWIARGARPGPCHPALRT